ncbi:MAG: hypothetical protein E7218_00965 [Anaerofustis stercorihominis]|nr:hypothetical protein [Anaerofustis stercorihominis]
MKRESTYCRVCGSEIKSGARRCPYCKSKVHNTADNQTANKKKQSKYFRTSVILLVCLMVLCVFFSNLPPKYERVNTNDGSRRYEATLRVTKDNYYSRGFFIRELKRNGYTDEEAEIIAANSGINWKEQSVLYVKNYKGIPFTKDEMYWYLIEVQFFTEEEAKYAMENAYEQDEQ